MWCLAVMDCLTKVWASILFLDNSRSNCQKCIKRPKSFINSQWISSWDLWQNRPREPYLCKNYSNWKGVWENGLYYIWSKGWVLIVLALFGLFLSAICFIFISAIVCLWLLAFLHMHISYGLQFLDNLTAST